VIKFLAGIVFACGCILVNDVMNYVERRDRQLEELKQEIKKVKCDQKDRVLYIEDAVVRQRVKCVVA
jgi:hypothetical protein